MKKAIGLNESLLRRARQAKRGIKLFKYAKKEEREFHTYAYEMLLRNLRGIWLATIAGKKTIDDNIEMIHPICYLKCVKSTKRLTKGVGYIGQKMYKRFPKGIMFEERLCIEYDPQEAWIIYTAKCPVVVAKDTMKFIKEIL